MRFEGTRVVFWPLSCYKELKLTTNWFTGRYTSQPSDPDAKYQLTKFGHAQKAKFLGLKVTQQS